MSYISLNVKTEYSFLNSALKINDYILKGKKLNLKTLAICDNNPYAFPYFYSRCIENNIKPVLGMEFKYKFNDIELQFALYIKNEEGYDSFLYNISKVENDYLNDLDLKKDGLICILKVRELFSSCSLNTIKNSIYKLQLGFKNFYLGLEIYSKDDINLNEKIINFAKEYTYNYIPFPLIKALNKNDGLTLKILDSINNDQTLSSAEKIDTPYFFISEKALEQIYPSDSLISFDTFEQVNFDLFKKRGEMYSFNIPNKKEYLYSLCLNELKNYSLENNQIYLDRLNYELDIIAKMNYLDYFLIVREYVKQAKDNDIYVGPGRGSAAGSLVCYCLNITKIDPIKYNLLFERFLNSERVTMPDIDVDFQDIERSKVINNIIDFFSFDNVKSIITFQIIKAKQAIRDIGKVFSFNPSDINLLCKSLGKYDTLEEGYVNSLEFKELLKEKYYLNIISLAKLIEGFPRQKGIHAAGIIINNKPINKVIPLFKNDEITSFEANYLEKLGFLKMDILGLRNLTFLKNIISSVKIKNNEFDIYKIDLNDEKTFNCLNNGFTKSIFQLEGDGITKALKLIHIDNFNDIVALNALYRPGPMDNINEYALRKKGKAFTYLNENIKEILKDTYGIIIYQEQVMLIAQKVANFSLNKADLLRRAISKKESKQLLDLKKDFITGGLNNNYKIEELNDLYNYIYKFGDYGFNKSHSVAYSLISYQLAYLKANHPLNYYQTLFDSLKNSNDKYTIYSNELNYFSIKLLNPNINESTTNYIIKDNSLLLPLDEISTINNNLAINILNERKKKKFSSLEDFIIRMLPYGFKKGNFENLINAGCFDEFTYNRKTNLNLIDDTMLFASSIPQNNFLTTEELMMLKPVVKEYKDNILEKNTLEILSLGTLLSGELFKPYELFLNHYKTNDIFYCLNHYNILTNVPVVVASFKEIKTKNGQLMAILEVFDSKCRMKAIIFPKKYSKDLNIKFNDYILLSGFYNQDSKGESFIINKITKMEVNHE